MEGWTAVDVNSCTKARIRGFVRFCRCHAGRTQRTKRKKPSDGGKSNSDVYKYCRHTASIEGDILNFSRNIKRHYRLHVSLDRDPTSGDNRARNAR